MMLNFNEHPNYSICVVFIIISSINVKYEVQGQANGMHGADGKQSATGRSFKSTCLLVGVIFNEAILHQSNVISDHKIYRK